MFQYSKYHTLSEVDEAGYRNCSTASAVLSSSDGNTTVALTAPGDRYFVCGNELHCLGGMRLHVPVSEPASPGGAGATPASPGGGGAFPGAAGDAGVRRRPRRVPPGDGGARGGHVAVHHRCSPVCMVTIDDED